jgi:hypothetical protein
MEEDEKKLSRVLSYLYGSRDQVMKMTPSGIFRVEAFVHASFVAHPDGKSHSGIVIQTGGVSVYFGSRKQKCVSKSPTEAELVVLSDTLGFMELFAEFLAFVKDTKQLKPIIYQDSTLAITMVVEGGGATRTKHMRTRLHGNQGSKGESCGDWIQEYEADEVGWSNKNARRSRVIGFRDEVLHLTD